MYNVYAYLCVYVYGYVYVYVYVYIYIYVYVYVYVYGYVYVYVYVYVYGYVYVYVYVYDILVGGLEHFFIFHNIWDYPSHWFSYFSEGLKPPTNIYIYIYSYIVIFIEIMVYRDFTTRRRCCLNMFLLVLYWPGSFFSDHRGVGFSPQKSADIVGSTAPNGPRLQLRTSSWLTSAFQRSFLGTAAMNSAAMNFTGPMSRIAKLKIILLHDTYNLYIYIY